MFCFSLQESPEKAAPPPTDPKDTTSAAESPGASDDGAASVKDGAPVPAAGGNGPDVDLLNVKVGRHVD